MRKYLVIALSLGFALIAVNAFLGSKPSEKAPIYNSIKPYSPYYLDKRFGGLQIMSKLDPQFKEKPDNMEVFHRLEFLEREWGKQHLKIENNQLIILDNNNSILATVPISTKEDRTFIHKFYGI